MLREQWQAARHEARRWEGASEEQRQAAAQLLTLTGRAGWRLLVDRHWPGRQAANVYMLLIGPAGVFVIDVKDWRADPLVVAGGLASAGEARNDDVQRLLGVTRTVEDALAEFGMSPVAVQPLMVFAGKQVDAASLGRIHLLGEREVGPWLLAGSRRLLPPMVRAVAEHLERTLPEYENSSVSEAALPAGAGAPDAEPLGLFDIEAMRNAALDEAMRAPIERWMTFLHPDQVALVRRNWAGPARISGPAGTGKTVVALHRTAHLAQRTTGRVLYVTFASNLPRVQQTFLSSVAPHVANRVDFHSLHAWAFDYLRARAVQLNVNGEKAETAFSLAWKRVGRESALAELVPQPQYWHDEIAYVIKGRGITTFADYVAVRRRGRHTVLRSRHKEAVWALYQAYESIRAERGVHDFNDLLSLALAEVQGGAIPPYAAVIADEVQDLTLVGARLLHALVGDAPNGLLLVGDGQQAVYPGGFRLSDAGIEVRGDRGQVLRTNYRNAKEILDTALEGVAGDSFEDIDGVRLSGRRDVELIHHDGVVERVERSTSEEHDKALVEVLNSLDAEQQADSAVLCSSKRTMDHYQWLFAQFGIPVFLLERYDGHSVPGVKLGSYRRSKGLEFKRVYLPRWDTAVPTGEGSAEAARERQELARRQLFVAMTRARDVLWLGSVSEAANAGNSD
ncbi:MULTISPECIES: nuclease-related domain-containing DEAD/DEAH box helicase [unclassified Streptomyces]|uniref:nuclease-related domain-containing DEAD/DEAH box helicase n=1 Tax=unclassified Streptomyces TaxID=2593676 RepID=UPI002E2D1E09|nr:UvrD-helicase domain-containing protein [Streptomyces sp. NBC_00223]